MFAGIALLLLWACFPSRAVFTCGVVSALVIAALYAPVYHQFLNEMRTYKDQWGEAYAELPSVVQTVSFLWPEITPWAFMGTFLVAAVVPYHLRRVPGVLATRFFVVIPLAFALLTIASELLRAGPKAVWLASLIGISVATVQVLAPQIRDFSFTPIEAWLEVASYIEGHFPPGTKVYAPFRNQYLRPYLSDAYPFAEFDFEEFGDGKLIYVESNYRASTRFDPKVLNELAAAARIEQRRGDYQVIGWVPH
jgi:hypothetical protein